jgi:hypothetical protein
MTLRARVNRWVEDERGRIIALSLAAETGHGPTLLAVAATNHPVIKNMRRLEVVLHEGEEMIKAQIVRFGTFLHPKAKGGKFVLDMKWARRILDNWKANILGQAIFLDPEHDMRAGSLGEMVSFEIIEGDGANAYFKPTPDGLDAVKSKKYSYASVFFHPDYKGSEVKIDAGEEFKEVDLFQLALAEVGDDLQLQEERAMAGKDKRPGEGAPDQLPPGGPAPDETVLALAERESAIAAAEAKLAEDRAAMSTEVAEMRAEMKQERIQLAEQGRLAQVDALLAKAELPNEAGFCIDKGLLDVVAAALRCEDIEGGAVKLSEDDSPSLDKWKAYFYDALYKVLELAPRGVPTAGGIQGSETRPGSADTIQLAKDRDQMFENIKLANSQKAVPLTVEQMWAKVDARYPKTEGV